MSIEKGQADAWVDVYLLCRELGMGLPNGKSGIELVTDFIRSSVAKQEPSAAIMDCGCSITQESIGQYIIGFCVLHKNAPKMLSFAKKISYNKICLPQNTFAKEIIAEAEEIVDEINDELEPHPTVTSDTKLAKDFVFSLPLSSFGGEDIISKHVDAHLRNEMARLEFQARELLAQGFKPEDLTILSHPDLPKTVVTKASLGIKE